MKIQVYGKGCARCHDLAGNAEKALKEAGIEAQVEYVTDINRITGKGIMLTPALVIEEEVIGEGKILSVDDIKKAIANR